MAFSERSRSQSRDLSKHNRPKFQTKYKSRGNNRSAMNIENQTESKVDGGSKH